MCLSLWRIYGTDPYKIAYICFAVCNSLYSSIWDVMMDTSLLQQNSKPPLLRNHRGFSWTWTYYAFIVIDPILRFSWIFYVILVDQHQIKAQTSFYITIAEVVRRFLWNFYRVENEHMANVAHYRASREVPLPFATFDPLNEEQIVSPQTTTLSSGDALANKSTTPRIHEAHANDFARKPGGYNIDQGDHSDEDDEDDESELDERGSAATVLESNPIA